MEVNINKRDLRKIRLKLGRLVSNVNRANYREQNDALEELMNYIEETSLLNEYIKSLKCDITGLEDLVRQVNNSYGRKAINQGPDPRKRTYILYSVFKQIIKEDFPTYQFGWYYASGSNKYQDMAEAFGEGMVYPFYSEIESYLGEIAIDMGYDDNETIHYNITASGDGIQVNVASDNAKVESSQTNTWNQSQINDEIKKLEEILKEIEETPQKEVLENNIQLLKSEVSKTNPKNSTIKTILSTLKFMAIGISITPDFIVGLKIIAELIGIQL